MTSTRVRPETVIEDDVLTVEPGQMAHTTMTVRNVGDQIAEYEVSMVPDCVAASWTVAEPASFRLMPGKDQRVLLRFQPPVDSSTPAGSFPYGVVVTPDEQHQAPTVAEADIAIGAFHALAAELKPAQSRGRWRGKHVVKLHNQGTDDVRVKLSPPEEDEALSYALVPTTLAIPARAKAEAFLKVRPRTLKMMGKPADHSFEVTYRRRGDSRSAVGAPGAGVPEGGEVEAQLQGSFTQKPLVSKALLIGLALVTAGVVLLAVFRPWEPPKPRKPPEPLENIQMISTEDDAVVVSWDNTPSLDEVNIREVDCGTRDDVLPTPEGEPTPVETTSPGRQSFPLEAPLDGSEAFAPGSDHCLQARAITDGEASIWGPNPAVQVKVGDTLTAPENVDAVHVGECKVDVEWTPVVSEGSSDVVYEVSLGASGEEPAPVGEPVAEGRFTSEEQEPGDIEVIVATVVEGFDPQPSEPVEVEVPDDCEEQAEVPGDAARSERDAEDEDGDGDGDGDGGTGGPDGEGEGEDGEGEDGEPGSDAVELTGQYWLLMHRGAEPLDEEKFKDWVTQWQVFGGNVGLYEPAPELEDEDFQPRLGIVGLDVLLPESLLALPGTENGDEILYVDLYGEDQDTARRDCAELNAWWNGVESMKNNFQPCRLVDPEGEVFNIRPSDTEITPPQ